MGIFQYRQRQGMGKDFNVRMELLKRSIRPEVIFMRMGINDMRELFSVQRLDQFRGGMSTP